MAAAEICPLGLPPYPAEAVAVLIRTAYRYAGVSDPDRLADEFIAASLRRETDEFIDASLRKETP